MNIWRIIEHQHKMYEYNATTNEGRAEHLKRFIESTKPEPYYPKWHELIATQFRYPVPVGLEHMARFRPAGLMKNVFYAAEETQTSLYEHAYWFFRIRNGMKKIKKTGQRTLYAAKLIQQASITDITNHPEVTALTNPSDWSASHNFICSNPQTRVIRYPSCRDPKHRANYAVFEIAELEKDIDGERVISFSYDVTAGTLRWIEFELTINRSHLPGLPNQPTPKKSSKRRNK